MAFLTAGIGKALNGSERLQGMEFFLTADFLRILTCGTGIIMGQVVEEFRGELAHGCWEGFGAGEVGDV